MTVKLDTDLIRTIALFEKVTKVHARDCITTENGIYFLVDNDKVGLAVGRSGSTIKELRRLLGRQVKVLGYADTPEEQVRSLVPSVKSIETNNGSLVLSVPRQDRVAVIGRNGANIRIIKEIMKRHFSIKDIRLK